MAEKKNTPPHEGEETFEHAYFAMIDQFNSRMEQFHPKEPGLMFTFFNEAKVLQKYRFNNPLRSVKQKISCCKQEGGTPKEKIQDMLKLVKVVAKAMVRDIKLEVKYKPHIIGNLYGATDIKSFSEIFNSLNQIMIEMVNFAFDNFSKVLDPVDKFFTA